jgi:hypothetical protein
MADYASWARKDLADFGVRHPFTVTDAKPDNALSISSEVIRGVSAARGVWLRTAGLNMSRVARAGDPGAIPATARQITRFAAAWLGPSGKQQNEHALESRILRGHTLIAVSGVGVLDPIPPPRRGLEDYVNWGSQFPTLWGTNGPARYLDALLHKGRTPWAIEIKGDIDGSGTGIGGYYRHAISQAVLYPPVHPRRDTPAWLVPEPGPRRRGLPRGSRRPRPHGRQRPPRPPRRPTKHLPAVRRRTD